MLRNIKDLRGYAIRAIDGVIGKVDDFYFGDDTWAIRYLVVDTGRWLSGRKVLISPIALGHAGWMGRQLPFVAALVFVVVATMPAAPSDGGPPAGTIRRCLRAARRR
jgi:hypothetical protein